MKKYIVGLSLVLSITSYADEDTVYLMKGASSPFNGYLIDVSRAQRIAWLEANYSEGEKVSALKDQEIDILNQRVNNANKEVRDLSSRLTTQDNGTHLKELLMFSLGAVMASGVAYGAVRLVR
jgi:hypothetical protein